MKNIRMNYQQMTKKPYDITNNLILCELNITHVPHSFYIKFIFNSDY